MGKGYKATAKVKVIDKGWKLHGEFIKQLDRSKPSVTVGIHADKGSAVHIGGQTATVADIGAFNEFGTPTIPRRSFIRSTFSKHLKANKRLLRALLQRVVITKITPHQALDAFGQKLAAQVINTINDGVPPPNAPATIARKGSSKTLINQGQMKQSIAYKVNGV